MKLVAVVRKPAQPDEAVRALAEAAGLAPAEARMRLAPEPPAFLARMEPEAASRLVVSLRRAGLAALAIDAEVPGDEVRTVARAFSFEAAGVTFAPRAGEPVRIAFPDVLAILRGTRSSRVEVERAEKSKGFSAATALATGGLVLRRTSTKTVRSSEERSEQVIFVFPRDGRAVVLSESEVDFSCLGPGMQPSSTGNMAELARRLREKATGAFYDERLLRLGRRPLPFLAGGESRTQTASAVTTRSDTAGSLDALAEALRQALLERLLP